MKKKLPVLIVLSILLTMAVFPASAAGEAAPVPRVVITTADGSGLSLEKADGYVSASVSITDVDGSELSGSVQFKVRGNSTALTFVTKKAFTFKFDKKQDVLGMGKAKKWALLANTFDPTLMRNYIAFDFAQTMELPYTSQQRVVELWLDGSYRGCYTLMEPVQAGKERVDIDVERNDGLGDFMIERENSRTEEGVTYFGVDGIRFAVNEPEEPTADQLTYIKSTMNSIMSTVKTGTREQIEAVIDVPSFVRFYLLNELYKTVDFDFSSVFFYYKDGVLYAGPAWDYDLAAGNVNAGYSSTSASAYQTSGLFAAERHFYRYLCSYDWFNAEIRSTLREYYDYISSITAEGGLMDSLLSEYGDVFARNYSDAGWSPSKWWVNVQKRPLIGFDANVDFLRGWLSDRSRWLAEYYKIIDGVFRLGDADGDGTVTILDATKIQRILAGFTPDEAQDVSLRGNVSGSELDILDATIIQRWLAGLAVHAPVGEYIDAGDTGRTRV